MRRLVKLAAITAGIVAGLFVAGIAMAARNSAGSYALPSHHPFQTGSPISASQANTSWGDVSTELTDSLSRSAKGAMLAPLRLYDGNLAAPGVAWGNEVGTGFFRAGTRDVRFALSGTLRAQCSDAGFSWIAATADGASAVGYAFDTTTSLANAGAKLVSFKNGGVEKLSIDKDGVFAGAGVTAAIVTGTTSVTTPLVQQTTANSAITVKGNRDGADAGADVIVNSAATRTAGTLLDVQNNTASKFSIDFNGEPSLQGGLAVGQSFKTDALQEDTVAGGPTAITGMSFAVAASGVYVWEMMLPVIDATTTGTIYIQFTGPAAPTSVMYDNIPSSAAGTGGNAFGDNIDVSSSGAGAADSFPVLIMGVLVNGANAGTVTALFSLNGTGNVKVLPGAWLRWRRIA
jgi:hypothetical protein